MPETIQDRKIFSLSEVAASIDRTLAERYKSAYWIKAEIIRLNHYPHSGHCYPDLAEKREDKVVAQIRATMWKSDFIRINKIFSKITGEPLKNGIQVLIKAEIVFDALHGLTLHILDIDPSFSLGEMESEKAAAIQRLKAEGLFDQNKKQVLPLLPRRIAVISVETSKGYADFTNILQNNSFGYTFTWMLFPSILQGDVAVKSIIRQLNRIRRAAAHFDAVVIVRGGGGDIGLACYNHYELARTIAAFPMPVLTGIGHATNETVCEMIAYQNAITPTELANFLINCYHHFSQPLKQAQQRIANRVRLRLQGEKQAVENACQMLSVLCRRTIEKKTEEVNRTGRQLSQFLRFSLQARQNTLDQWENTIHLCDPAQVLLRGYSYLLKEGKAIKHLEELAPGDTFTAVMAGGRLEAQVNHTEKNSDL